MRATTLKFFSLLGVGAIFFVLPPTGYGDDGQLVSSQGKRYHLEELQQLALKNNPTVAQAEAGVRVAEGQELQSGLYPNPVVGYDAEEVDLGDASDRGYHSIFVEQRIVTAGKLKHGRAIFTNVKAQAEINLEAQRQRVLNDVRMAFYQLLGMQEIFQFRSQLAGLTREALDVTTQLYNLGQADQTDVLEAGIEAQKAEVALTTAENGLSRAWTALAGVVGDPELPVLPVAGDMSEGISHFNKEELVGKLLRESPQVQALKAGMERAEAQLRRAQAERYPDFTLRAGYTYDNELDDSLVLFGVAVPLPLFDRNQGGIATAKGELSRAQAEIQRMELSLRAQFAAVYTEYANALEMVERYRESVLPMARRSYDLFLGKFKQMEAAYPQVLIAQRNFFESQVEYVRALTALRVHEAKIEGFLLAGGLDAPQAPVSPGSFRMLDVSSGASHR